LLFGFLDCLLLLANQLAASLLAAALYGSSCFAIRWLNMFFFVVTGLNMLACDLLLARFIGLGCQNFYT
jgi:hypothetical protein